jgi:hypothetical protein
MEADERAFLDVAATTGDGGRNVAKVGLARSERFELPTLGIEIRCSIQLSYERVRARIAEISEAFQPAKNQKQGWRRPSWPI